MLPEVEIVSVDDEPDWTEEGLKLAVAPLGRPDAVRFTVCALPEVVAVPMVVVAAEPGWTLPEAGLRLREKSLPGCEVHVVSPDWAGRPGRVRRDRLRWLVGTELLLDRVYNSGEAFLIEYKVVIDQPIDENEYFRAFARSIGLYVLHVQFAQSELPGRCYQFESAQVDQPRTEQEIHLTYAHSALLATQNPGRGIVGIRWEWE